MVIGYLVKPFSYSEPLAPIRVILRRQAAPQVQGEPMLLHIADLQLDLWRRRAVRGEDRLELTPKEFACSAC